MKASRVLGMFTFLVAAAVSLGGTTSVAAVPPAEPDLGDGYVGGGEPGQALPLIILLHAEGSSPEAARAVLAPLQQPARVITIPGAHRNGNDQFFYIDPQLIPNSDDEVMAKKYAAAQVDEITRLVGIVETIVKGAGAVPMRAVLVGLGASGALAAAVAMRTGYTVRQAWGTGGTVQAGWVPDKAPQLNNMQRPQMRKLSYEEPGYEASVVALAQKRGFDFQIFPLLGPPDLEAVQVWMLADLAVLLGTP
jgi:hypothetical protein